MCALLEAEDLNGSSSTWSTPLWILTRKSILRSGVTTPTSLKLLVTAVQQLGSSPVQEAAKSGLSFTSEAKELEG